MITSYLSWVMLRIFYDLSFFGDQRVTGIERFSLELYRRLKNSSSIEYVCALPKNFNQLNPDVTNIHLSGNSKVINHFVRVPMLLWRKKFDAYFYPLFPPCLLSFRSIRKSYRALHDAVFWENSETLSKVATYYLKPMEQFLARKYRGVITVSDFSRKTLVKHLRLDSERIHVVSNGVSDIFKSAAPDVAKVRDLSEEPVLLSVGTIEPRKNYPYLVDIFDQLCERGFRGKLVICGREGWGYETLKSRIEKSAYQDRVVIRSNLSDQELLSSYQDADLFIYPSKAEGFGIPLVEAMACGTAIIASDNTAITEVVSDCGVLINGYELEDWVDAVEAVLEDNEQRHEMISKGLEKMRQYTWDASAVKFMETVR